MGAVASCCSQQKDALVGVESWKGWKDNRTVVFAVSGDINSGGGGGWTVSPDYWQGTRM